MTAYLIQVKSTYKVRADTDEEALAIATDMIKDNLEQDELKIVGEEEITGA